MDAVDVGAKGRVRGGKKYRKIITDKLKLAQSLNFDILAGIPEDTAPYPTGENVAMVGAKNEFGSEADRIPPRPFLQTTLDKNKKYYGENMVQIVEGVMKRGRDAMKGGGLLGTIVQDDIKRKIEAIKYPPNSAYTIEKKGSSNPLIDTGHMIQSIRYKIEPRKGK